MNKPKNPDTKNPAVNQAVTQGQVNTQGKKGSQRLQDENTDDQSEGANRDGQPTARHGQGAGFSRNIH